MPFHHDVSVLVHPWTKSAEPWARINHSSLSGVYQIFCSSLRKPTNIHTAWAGLRLAEGDASKEIQSLPFFHLWSQVGMLYHHCEPSGLTQGLASPQYQCAPNKEYCMKMWKSTPEACRSPWMHLGSLPSCLKEVISWLDAVVSLIMPPARDSPPCHLCQALVTVCHHKVDSPCVLTFSLC